MEVVRTVVIERPQRAVHEYVSDPRNDTQWCPKVLSVEARDEAAGIYVVVHRPIPLRPTRTIDHRRLESTPRRIRWREDDGTDVFHVTYELDALGAERTTFTQRSEFELGAPAITHPLMRLGIGRDVAGQLKRLKRVLESASDGRSGFRSRR